MQPHDVKMQQTREAGRCCWLNDDNIVHLKLHHYAILKSFFVEIVFSITGLFSASGAIFQSRGQKT